LTALAGESELEAGLPSAARRRATPRGAFALVVLAILAFGVLAVRYHGALREELTESALARRTALAQLAAATLSERLDRTTDLARSLATRVRFAELVAAGRWEAAGEVLERVPREFAFVERLFLADLQGTLRFDVPALPGVRGVSFAQRDWYQGVSRNWETHVSTVYTRAAEPRRNVVAVVTPVRELSSGRVAGILVLQLSLEALFDWAATIAIPAGASLLAVDAQGGAGYANAVSAQGPIADLSANPAVERLARGRSGIETVTLGQGAGERLFAYFPAGHGWGIVIEEAAELAFAARDLQLRFVWLAYGLLVLFLLSIGSLALRAGKERLSALRRSEESLARHAERLRILRQIDRAVASEEAPDAIAAAVIRPLRALLAVPRAIVNRFDIEAGEVEWIAAAGRRRTHVGPGIRYPIRLMGNLETLRRGEPQRIETDALPPGPEVEALLASGIRIYMAVPMIAAGELIGAVSFGGEAGDFSREQMAIAQEVATQLAIAITQASLRERLGRQAQELERRVAERTAALDEANRELEDLYNNAPCGYHSVDEGSVIMRANDTWLAWLGRSRAEVVGRMGHPELMTPASAERFRAEAFPRFKRQGWLKGEEFEYRRKDGSTFVGSLNATTVSDAGGRYVMSRSTVFDVSERKRAEEAMRALNEELEGFSYSVSHDLRAPLRAVDGFARMLEEDYAGRLDDEGRRLLGVVRESAQRMGHLIDDLLAFSRLGRQELAKREVDMDALVGEVLEELSAPAAAIERAALPGANADRTLIKQVWANLVANAVKYSGRRAEPRIEIGGRAQGRETQYWVRDNGVGFDMRYAGKLFGVFQRLHSADEFPGTGVGLAIVQRVLARHGGRAWAEGRPGEGACFYFSLPREA
jgi:PAS domain S-box-containing protein